ncbi:MAG: F0F1 ATP synthase subunit A [Candidatus Azobacteroides pseudotrichonymphae]|jgi:F-type H+-transporting ATPase subunit a|nr:F0F1 ATP synthase subunit A [Bacteroidales bacterium OttesenSCG-928-I14]GMO32245.1 MAG: F0F1 ATP synthase subunit A [Candidatus Azobacteroides pseudotrichonymphae]
MTKTWIMGYKFIIMGVFTLFVSSFRFLPIITNNIHKEKQLNVRELILDHMKDSYSWHIAPLGTKYVSIPLPIIVKGQADGWHLFSSSRFCRGNKSYKGFSIAQVGNYKDKIVETLPSGVKVRPWDFSLTKNAVSLILSSITLISLILFCSCWYKKRNGKPEKISPKGFISFIELIIMDIINHIIKPCIGKNYKRYTSYLLTVFFFILINNLLGLIPVFPGGANVTGNVTVACVLAVFTFVFVNIFGTKKYWKEIFWPNVPLWLKIPIPIIPAIEIIGIFTKPFALMIRLLANIMAGHAMILGLTCIIFLTTTLGVVVNMSMTVLSVIMTLFINCVELLVAYIQAYVFTMLSAVFIGLSQIESHCKK